MSNEIHATCNMNEKKFMPRKISKTEKKTHKQKTLSATTKEYEKKFFKKIILSTIVRDKRREDKKYLQCTEWI